jgi:hypothetical protein
VRITNRLDGNGDAINFFKMVFVKSPPGKPKADYIFSGGLETYLIPGPSA